MKATGKLWEVEVTQKDSMLTIAYFLEGRPNSSSTVTERRTLTDETLQEIANIHLAEVENKNIQRIYTNGVDE